MSKKGFDSKDYTITVNRIDDDNDGPVYEATVLEIPQISDFADTPTEAYDLVLDSIQTTKAIFDEKNKAFPSPHSNDR